MERKELGGGWVEMEGLHDDVEGDDDELRS